MEFGQGRFVQETPTFNPLNCDEMCVISRNTTYSYIHSLVYMKIILECSCTYNLLQGNDSQRGRGLYNISTQSFSPFFSRFLSYFTLLIILPSPSHQFRMVTIYVLIPMSGLLWRMNLANSQDNFNIAAKISEPMLIQLRESDIN